MDGDTTVDHFDPIPIEVLLSKNEWFSQNTLIYVFEYLNTRDLLKASRVCRLWHQIAFDKRFWRSVTVSNCRLHWAPMARELAKLQTKELRLIDCIFMLNTDYLIGALKVMPTLRKIEFSECSSIFVQRIPEANPELEEVNLNLIGGFGVQLELEFLARLPKLRKIGLKCNRDAATILPLLYVKKTLTHLSLTEIHNLAHLELDILSMLTKLAHLSLGNCFSLPSYFTDTILNLHNLKELRLENCKDCPLTKFVESASTLKNLQQLELIGINVDKGFSKAIALCKNIKQLVIVPNARRLKTADGNTQVVDGALKLQDNLTHFTLGFATYSLNYFEKTYEMEKAAPFLADAQTYPDTVIPELLEILPVKTYEKCVKLKSLNEFLSKKMPKVKVNIVEWAPKWPYTSSCANCTELSYNL